MPKFTHDQRPISLTTPLGKDVLLLEHLEGREAVSEPFTFRLDLLAENGSDIPFEQLLGQNVSIELRYPGRPIRHLHGMIRTFAQSGQDETFTWYEAEVVPRFWRLSRRVQSRIFQRKTVIETLREVLDDIDVTFRLSSDYRRHEYCVQYRESDFDFASRLMEEEGLHYYFVFSEDRHQMVISDSSRLALPISGDGSVRYQPTKGGIQETGRVRQWKKVQEIRSSSYSLRDYTHEAPADRLEANHSALAEVTIGGAKHRLLGSANKDLFVQQYPGGYAHRFDRIGGGGGIQAETFGHVFHHKNDVARLRMEEEDAQALRISGSSDLHHLTPGHAFTLDGHFNSNGDYVVTAVEHRASNSNFRSDVNAEAAYSNTFACLPSELPYRPVRKTPVPTVQGTQTATVVGPEGETIFTDPCGRVKVQFHWDREHQFNADSSCWVRVSQGWAGKGFGFHAIPRVGHEVLVDFLEGDPDCPIIVGSLYNATNSPPQSMPGFKTRSFIKSQSVSHSADDPAKPENCHGMMLDDAKGSELLHIHSERTRSDSTEMDHFVNAGRSHHTHVGAMCVHQVGGFPGRDHSTGPTTPNYHPGFQGTSLIRSTPATNSGSGSGGLTSSESTSHQDTTTSSDSHGASSNGHAAGGEHAKTEGALTLEVPGSWGQKLELCIGLESGAVIGNTVEMTLGTYCNTVINPSGLVSVFVSNPLVNFLVNTAVGIGQSLATTEFEQQKTGSDAGSMTESWANKNAFTIPGTPLKYGNKAIAKQTQQLKKDQKKADEAAAKKAAAHRRELAKKFAAESERAKKLQNEVNHSQKALDKAKEEKANIDSKLDDVNKRCTELEDRIMKNPNDQALRQEWQQEDAKRQALEHEQGQADDKIDQAEHDLDAKKQALDADRNARKQTVKDAEKAAEEKKQAYRTDQSERDRGRDDDHLNHLKRRTEGAKNEWVNAFKEKEAAEDRLRQAKKECDARKEEADKIVERLKQDPQDAAAAAELKTKMQELKAARDHLKSCEDDVKDADEKYSDADKEYDNRFDEQKAAEKKINDTSERLKNEHEEAERKVQDAKDRQTASEEGEHQAAEHEAHASGDHEAGGHSGSSPTAGDITSVGSGKTEICVGCMTDVLYGPKFEIHRGTAYTTVHAPFDQTPMCCKIGIALYSALEVATSCLESANPGHWSNERMMIFANLAESTVPTMLQQILVAMEYANPTIQNAKNVVAATATQTAAATANAPAVPGTFVQITESAKNFIAKLSAEAPLIINILVTAVTAVPQVYTLIKGKPISGMGSGPDDWDFSDISSGSGGAGLLGALPDVGEAVGAIQAIEGAMQGAVADIAPRVENIATSYVMNTSSIELNTHPNLEATTDSVISLNAMGALESPGVINAFASGTVLLQAGAMTFIKAETNDAEIGSVNVSCGEDGLIKLGNGAIPTNSLLIDALGNTLTAGENVMTHNEDGFMFEVGDTEVAFTEEGVEIMTGGSSISMSADSITLEAGGATLTLSSAGIIFEGPIIEMTAEGAVNIDGSACAIESDDISLSGAAVEIDAAAVTIA